jgi:hypothetical protein
MRSNLTLERHQLVLEDFETEARRLEIFACWLELAEVRCSASDHDRARQEVGLVLQASSCIEP